MCQSIGGVTQKHAIKFYVQLAFGEKADKVLKAKDFKTLVELCLRQSWGPAFSHVSKNADEFKEEKNSKQEKIIQGCIKNLLNMYCDYFQAKEKSEYLRDNLSLESDESFGFKGKLRGYKVTDSISIGHFQKLFNMTTKHLLTLYLLREYIWDDCDFFEKFDGKDIKDFFKHADCPIDSKILGKVYTKQNLPANTWSQFDYDDYSKVQNEISQKVGTNESNLFYDFEYWQTKKAKKNNQSYTP